MTAVDKGKQPGFGWAGLAAGPAALAIGVEGNYAIVRWTCTSGVHLVPILASILVLLSLAGAFVSWRAWKRLPHDTSLDDSKSDQPKRLMAAAGVFLGVLFAMVVAVQGAAGLILDGCAR